MLSHRSQASRLTVNSRSRRALRLPCGNTQCRRIWGGHVWSAARRTARTADVELLRHLQAIQELWASEQGRATATPAVAELLNAVLARRFVGVLNMRACLWLWDQVLLAGTDILLAPICAVFLVLLRDLLLQCQTRTSVERVLLSQAHHLTVRQL